MLRAMNRTARNLTVLSSALWLAACGDGGGSSLRADATAEIDSGSDVRDAERPSPRDGAADGAQVLSDAAVDAEVAFDPLKPGFQLVRDLNPRLKSAAPYGFSQLGNTVVFAAQGPTGFELYRTDGTEQGTSLLRDIIPGAEGSYPNQAVRLRDKLYFTANVLPQRKTLWSTDGTAAGTQHVYDFPVTKDESWVSALNVALGKLFMTVFDDAGQVHLYASDGTAAGTSAIAELAVESGVEYRGKYVMVAGTVGSAGASDQALWETDGTRAGTRRLLDVLPGATTKSLTELSVVDDQLYFSAFDGTQRRLYKSDGTAAGTAVLATLPTPGMGGVHKLGAQVVFVIGNQLWRSDGTQQGTTTLRSFEQVVSGLAVAGGYAYFAARDQDGAQMWRTDGTTQGTLRLTSASPDIRAYPPSAPVALGDAAYFYLFLGTHVEMWKSRGTLGSTSLVMKLGAGRGAYLDAPTPLADKLWLTCPTERSLGAVCVSNGTKEGTVVLAALQTVSGGSLSSAVEGSLTWGERVLFAANDGWSGLNLFVSDGTPKGTTRLSKVWVETALLSAEGKRAFFMGVDGATGSELWTTDGTMVGTQLVKDIAPGAASGLTLQGWEAKRFVQIGETLYFVANDGVAGDQLWRSDGSESSTRVVRDLDTTNQPAGAFLAKPLQRWAQRVVFSARDANGEALYAADDAMVTRITPYYPEASPLVALGEWLYFRTEGGALFKSKGTPESVSLVRDISSNDSGFYDGCEATGTEIYCRANDGETTQLWRSDGTTSGTIPLTLAEPGTVSLSTMDRQSLVWNGKLFFSAQQPNTNVEPWVSDFTPKGTHLLSELGAGAVTFHPRHWTGYGAHAYFSGTDNYRFYTLFRSDGSSVEALPSFSQSVVKECARPLGRAGGALLVVCDDGQSGMELWRYLTP